MNHLKHLQPVFAETCGFTTASECECEKKASHTGEAIKDVILAVVGDNNIEKLLALKIFCLGHCLT